MTPNQQHPITDKLEKDRPEHITDPGPANQAAQSSLAAFIQPLRDEPGPQDDSPLRIIPVITEDGTFQGYFLPAAEETPPPTPAGTVESFISDTPPVSSMPTVIPTTPAPTTTIAATPQPTQTATLISAILLFAIALATLSTVLLALTTKTMITITPQEQRYSATIPLHLVTGIPTSLSQVEARRLPSITLTQALSTQATGSYQQEPTYALGYLTFYNGALSSVTIPTGTQFTGQDSVSVVTTKTAIVPGVDQSATPPSLGQATIAAQAATIGSHGNIGAYDINITCTPCGSSILVKNTQDFTGGQDAKTFTIVKQADIDGMKAPLSASIQQSMSNAIQGQARPGETLLLNPCATTFSANHHAGDQAHNVTLTASETCSALVYNPNSIQTIIEKLVQAHAPSANFQLMEPPTVYVLSTTPTPIPTIIVSVTALFVYQFTPSERQHLAAQLAGKKLQQAYQLLRTTPGIANAVIAGVGYHGTIPNDTSRIIIRFQE